MKKIIAYVITSLDFGGTQKQLYYIVKMLKERKVSKEFYKEIAHMEPIIISLKRDGRYKKKFVSLGIKIYHLGMPEKFNLLTFFFLPRYFFKFIFIVIKEKPFIIHSFLFQANMFSILVKIFFPKCKVILSERVAEKEKWLNLKISKMFYKLNFLYDRVLVNSEDLKKFVISSQKVKEDKIIVIPNMIDLQNMHIMVSKEKIREALKIYKEDVMVLSIGRLHRQKGYDLLIEVAREIKNKKEKKNYFIVIGEGEERWALEKKLQEYELSDVVKFIGYKENVYDYINACDIFLLTSLWEGSPNVVLEAISFNKSVISTDVEGVREVLDGLDNCFVVSLKQDSWKIVSDIVEKILYLGRSKERISNGFYEVVKRYSLQNLLVKVLDLYTHL